MDREFKVQVGFSVVMKKLKKNAQGRYIDGEYDYAMWFKEAMLHENGLPLKFSNPDTAFKCAYNTTINVLNECLDARNVPNLDSSWRYTVLRGATIRIYTYRSVVQTGRGFFKLPTYIANKKACINPKSDSGCFWWSVKLGLLLNRKENYLKEDGRDEKELSKIENLCKELGIVHQWSDGETLYETEAKEGERNDVLEQCDLP